MQEQDEILRRERALPPIPPKEDNSHIRKPVPRSRSDHNETTPKDQRAGTNSADLASCDPQVVKLQDDLDKERIARIETQRRLNEAVKALGALHTTDPFRRDDDQIVKAVKDLRYDIKAWSHNFTRPLRKSIKAKFLGQNDPFLSVTPRSHLYTEAESAEGLPTIVQAFVWERLARDVFGSCVWAGTDKCLSNADKACPIYKAFYVLRSRFACM
jgi:hypothetical protein